VKIANLNLELELQFDLFSSEDNGRKMQKKKIFFP